MDSCIHAMKEQWNEFNLALEIDPALNNLIPSRNYSMSCFLFPILAQLVLSTKFDLLSHKQRSRNFSEIEDS